VLIIGLGCDCFSCVYVGSITTSGAYLGVYDGSITTSGPYVGAISMHLHWVLMLYRDESITTSRAYLGVIRPIDNDQ
jgi:hypothetical protein